MLERGVNGNVNATCLESQVSYYEKMEIEDSQRVLRMLLLYSVLCACKSKS